MGKYLTEFELVNQATEIIATLADIQKRPMKYAHQAELDWKDKELPKLAKILDELHYLTNPEFKLEVEVMEGQRELNYEHLMVVGT